MLSSFEPLPHRLERVAEFRGVTFYNDSKATNPAAALPALGAFDAGTIHLIVGGKDKGGDWPALVEMARARARGVYVIGIDPAPVARRFSDSCAVTTCGDLEDAVATAFAAAEPGDVVLLSPGCASFDQFDSFEHRGEVFRRAVRALGESHA